MITYLQFCWCCNEITEVEENSPYEGICPNCGAFNTEDDNVLIQLRGDESPEPKPEEV